MDSGLTTAAIFAVVKASAASMAAAVVSAREETPEAIGAWAMAAGIHTAVGRTVEARAAAVDLMAEVAAVKS
jgi:hypothetical protein